MGIFHRKGDNTNTAVATEVVREHHVTVSEDDYVDPKEERAFLWRLDLSLLLVGFLGHVFKYIDQTNFSNAYVSGMKEELSLYGNELNYFTTYFNIGYMVMLYPSCVMVSHFGPAVWLPTCEVLWGIFTCCLSTIKNAQQAYGLRFLVGFFEATAWPAYTTLISQWYLPEEYALRMSLFNIAQPAGAMISGVMQAGLTENLDGALGRSGWRWAFIINGVCTMFVAMLAYVTLPGYPDRQNPLSKIILKPRHMQIAQARLRRVGREPQKALTLKSFARCFTFWQLWAISIAWSFGFNTTPSSYFNLWLKSLKNPDGSNTYSVSQLNYIPIGGQAIQFVSEIIFGRASDRLAARIHTRLPFLLLHGLISITSLAIIIKRPENRHTYMAGWFLNYVGGASTMLLCAWATDHLQHEPQVRTVLFATGTVMSYILTATVPLAAFPAKEAPLWRIGAKVYIGFAVFTTCLYVAIHFAFRWQDRRDGRRSRLVEEEAETSTAEETLEK